MQKQDDIKKENRKNTKKIFGRTRMKIPWIRLRLFLKINLMLFAVISAAVCFAGVKVNDYFEAKTGLTVRDCFENGRLAVKDSRPEDFRSQKATNIYAADGKKIATVYKTKENTYLAYEEIPDFVKNAFIAVEDRSFWDNEGYDLKGIFRVGINYIKSGGRDAAGASTITQQLARQEYLTLDRTLSRKVAEIAAARDLTHMYTKEEILEYYVNMCCFANGIFGIQDASRAYFRKDVSELSLSQTAYLCAIPNWPEHYNPRKNAQTAITRRDKILGDMLELGYISRPQYEEAVKEKIKIKEPQKKKQDYDYETTYAIHCAAKLLMKLDGFKFKYAWDSDAAYSRYQEKYQEAYNKARDSVLDGGYDIYTSIDLKKQKMAQKAVNSVLKGETDKLENGIYKLQASMTVIDNETGKVVSIIGGRKQKKAETMFALNRAYQGYAQPGSTIKPIAVYAPAMEKGKNAVKDEDMQDHFAANSILRNIDVNTAKTSTGDEISSMGGSIVYLRNAVERSLNGCAYWLMNEIGVKRGLGHLSKMGFQKICTSDYTLSAALGGLTYGTTTEEMANAYHTLSQRGLYTDTDCIVSITDRSGKEIYEKPKPKRVYERDAADAMTDILKGVLKNGTAASSRWQSFTDIEAAGKTGTTNDNKAAWFCGYTPYYTIAVWVGCDTPESMAGLQGASYPLQIWQQAMLSFTDGKPKAEFPPMPDGMEEKRSGCICRVKCGIHTINSSCPVCSHITNGNSIDEFCKGSVPKCICTSRCSGDELNESCPACVQNPGLCAGVDTDTACICTDKCTEATHNRSCPRCSRNWTICAAEAPECICSENCGQNGLNKNCLVCMENTDACKGEIKKDEPQQKPEKPDKTEKPDKPEKPDTSDKEDPSDIENEDSEVDDGSDSEITDTDKPSENEDDNDSEDDKGGKNNEDNKEGENNKNEAGKEEVDRKGKEQK